MVTIIVLAIYGLFSPVVRRVNGRLSTTDIWKYQLCSEANKAFYG